MQERGLESCIIPGRDRCRGAVMGTGSVKSLPILIAGSLPPAGGDRPGPSARAALSHPPQRKSTESEPFGRLLTSFPSSM